MEESDKSGWAPIHHAAYRNHISLIERLIKSSGPEQLETLTNDSLQNTPLLLAASSGSKEMVNILIKHGADITFHNRQSHGVIEMCAIYEHVDLLRYFLSLADQNLNVYKKLVALLYSDKKDYIISACSVIAGLMGQQEDALSSLVDSLLAESLVLGLVTVLEKNIADNAKKYVFNILKLVLENSNAKKQVCKDNHIAALIPMVFSVSRQLVPDLLDAVCELINEVSFAETYSANIIPVLMKLLSNKDKDVLLPALKAMALMAAASPICKDALGKQTDLVPLLVQLFYECQQKTLMVAWSEAVGNIVEGNPNNQNSFICENIGTILHQMLKFKTRDVQMSAIKTIHRLVSSNVTAQKTFMEQNGISPLLHLLKRTRTVRTQEEIIQTLWALAGADKERQRIIAARIGVSLLVEFLETPSYKLNLIGTKALSVLVQGPYDVRNAVASASGAHHLVRLLTSNMEDVLLSAVQTVRHICLGVGFISHHKNQTAVAGCRGLHYLVALLIYSQSECIRVEAALTIAAIVLGHSENLGLLCRDSDFSYEYVLRLWHSHREDVGLLAGSALATFAFNCPSQQKAIVQCGGVRWYQFKSFLKSSKETFRTHAAFQLVILAPIILDKKPSYTCAVGIQTLVSLLEDSTSDETLALAADCVARLSHSRAGLPAAMVSIEVVSMLCQLLSSVSEQVQGSAAIALNYLSFNHVAQRQLLKRCREDPQLMKALIYFNKKQKWSTNFLERWKHIKELTLPPVRRRRVSLPPINNQIKDRTTPRNQLEYNCIY
ncbi:hypothetical protein XELAEV_18022713mg [Xenopus laevis]|uniref:Ankyrin and armadillo repeat-containing protein n=1 Tax=Xenopus laevis TaxID=8355 RepID=A0A974HNN6_XENLA|nr:hypothetical protein XELAEV_18022713mg [Xenopus laevis]